MGYEEALGYSVGPAVRDKDGISAALVFADMAAHEKAGGRTVLDRLADDLKVVAQSGADDGPQSCVHPRAITAAG